MKNQEQKEYEAPQTTCLEVELEQGFMKASVVDKEDSNNKVTAGNQTISGDYDFTDTTWQ